MYTRFLKYFFRMSEYWANVESKSGWMTVKAFYEYLSPFSNSHDLEVPFTVKIFDMPFRTRNMKPLVGENFYDSFQAAPLFTSVCIQIDGKHSADQVNLHLHVSFERSVAIICIKILQYTGASRVYTTALPDKVREFFHITSELKS